MTDYTRRLDRLEEQLAPIENGGIVVYVFDPSANPAATLTIGGQTFERDASEDREHFEKRVRRSLGVAAREIRLLGLSPQDAYL